MQWQYQTIRVGYDISDRDDAEGRVLFIVKAKAQTGESLTLMLPAPETLGFPEDLTEQVATRLANLLEWKWERLEASAIPGKNQVLFTFREKEEE